MSDQSTLTLSTVEPGKEPKGAARANEATASGRKRHFRYLGRMDCFRPLTHQVCTSGGISDYGKSRPVPVSP